MITKKRLKELIKQGATIYSISKETFIAGISDLLKIKPLKLDSKVYGISVDKYNEINNCKPHLYIGNDYTPFEKVAELENLFETKEDAEFALKFKRIPRTEYLDLPTWEEIDAGYETEFDNSCFEVYKTENRILVKTNGNYLDLYDYIFDKPATKENYLEACEICRKLWLGEEV